MKNSSSNESEWKYKSIKEGDIIYMEDVLEAPKIKYLELNKEKEPGTTEGGGFKTERCYFKGYIELTDKLKIKDLNLIDEKNNRKPIDNLSTKLKSACKYKCVVIDNNNKEQTITIEYISIEENIEEEVEKFHFTVDERDMI